ncbi:hypothetical protein ABT160_29260 [Streptomyces sp. NPDC001941]|uniref:hypothetical protein n=1 Tax=Streptomyces sp. NPDC001941 TaxID=3154659 RepID=UPI00332C4B23
MAADDLPTTRPSSTVRLAALTALLTVAEVVLVNSELDAGVRYGLGAALLAALAASTFGLSRSLRGR